MNKKEKINIVEQTIKMLANWQSENDNYIPIWISHFNLAAQISERKIRDLRKKGILHYSIIGANYYYKYSDIYSLVESNIISLDIEKLKEEHLFAKIF